MVAGVHDRALASLQRVDTLPHYRDETGLGQANVSKHLRQLVAADLSEWKTVAALALVSGAA